MRDEGKPSFVMHEFSFCATVFLFGHQNAIVRHKEQDVSAKYFDLSLKQNKTESNPQTF